MVDATSARAIRSVGLRGDGWGVIPERNERDSLRSGKRDCASGRMAHEPSVLEKCARRLRGVTSVILDDRWLSNSVTWVKSPEVLVLCREHGCLRSHFRHCRMLHDSALVPLASQGIRRNDERVSILQPTGRDRRGHRPGVGREPQVCGTVIFLPVNFSFCSCCQVFRNVSFGPTEGFTSD